VKVVLSVGEIIDNKYEIQHILGKGGMGTVYFAKHLSLKNYWAIKEISLNINQKVDLLAEPDALRKLKHPNLPSIIDIFQMGNNLYIVEDYIEGMPLNDLIAKNGALDEGMVIDIAIQICEVLTYLHAFKPKPIIYRDLKPANIIITPDGVAKLIDFGTSKELKEGIDNVKFHSLGFTPPEQYKGITDQKSDIYALGATLYNMISSKVPLRKEDKDTTDELKILSALCPKVSKGLCTIIKKCMESESKKRYSSAQELKIQLINIDELNRSFSKRRRVLRYSIILVVALGIVNSGVYFRQIHKNNVEALYIEAINQGSSYKREGKDLQAEKLLKDTISKYPEKIEAYKKLAELYVDKNMFVEAFSIMNNLEDNAKISLDKESNYLKGTAYFGLQEYQKAVNFFTSAFEADKNYTEAGIALSVCLSKLGNNEQALALLNELKTSSPIQPEIYYLSAVIAEGAGDEEEAKKNIDIAIEKDNTVEKYYVFLGDLYNKKGDVLKEIEALETLVKNKKNVTNGFYINLGDAYQSVAENEEKANYIDKSIEYYEKAKQGGIENPQVYIKEGRAFRIKKDFIKSEECFEKAMKLDENNGSVYIQLGYLYIEKENAKKNSKKDYTLALQYIETGISKNPNSKEAEQAKDYLHQIKGEESNE
jgi:serine/threonine protein kinase